MNKKILGIICLIIVITFCHGSIEYSKPVKKYCKFKYDRRYDSEQSASMTIMELASECYSWFDESYYGDNKESITDVSARREFYNNLDLIIKNANFDTSKMDYDLNMIKQIVRENEWFVSGLSKAYSYHRKTDYANYLSVIQDYPIEQSGETDDLIRIHINILSEADSWYFYEALASYIRPPRSDKELDEIKKLKRVLLIAGMDKEYAHHIYWYDYYIDLYKKDKLYGQHDEGYIPCESCYEEGEYLFEHEPGVKTNYCLKHYEDAVRYRSDFYKSTSNK